MIYVADANGNKQISKRETAQTKKNQAERQPGDFRVLRLPANENGQT